MAHQHKKATSDNTNWKISADAVYCHVLDKTRCERSSASCSGHFEFLNIVDTMKHLKLGENRGKLVTLW